MRNFLANRKFKQRLKSLSKSQSPSKGNKPKLKIGFLSQPGSYGSVVELFLAAVLKEIGYVVTIVFVDQSFPLLECHHKDRPEQWSRMTRRNCSSFRRLAKLLRLQIIPASTLSDALDSPLSLQDQELIVNASLLRHYRVGKLRESLKDLEQRKKLFTETFRKSCQVGQYFSSGERVDRLIMNHGLYATTGPARLVALKNNVPVLTFDRAKKQDTLNFSWTHSTDRWSIDDVWEECGSIPLRPEEEKVLDKYLQTRRNHSEDIYQYNRGVPTTAELLRQKLNIPEQKKILVLFTNVLWDAASSERDIIFESPIEWVSRTIEIAEEHQESLHLILRIHPAELVIGTEDGFQQIIESYFPKLPQNVSLLPANSDVNSWTLYELGDVGIVHTTTAGLEMAMEKKAVIVVSETHYRNKGFTIDPTSADEYTQLILNSKINESQQINSRLAKKYAYLIFIKYQFYFPFVSMDRQGRWMVQSTEFKDIISDPQFSHLIDCLDNRKGVLNPC
ncbi:hypothetical protein N9200_00665 [Akkermansiaceae bacterium]|nr:hypothetical protein [Akkermansiaceae bacterium]